MRPRIPQLSTADLVSPSWEAYARLAAPIGGPFQVGFEPTVGPHRLIVARDDCGEAVGVLLIEAGRRDGRLTSLRVVVHPRCRRRGIATALYQHAAAAGINVESLSGRNGLTPDGAAFRSGRRAALKEAVDGGLVAAMVGA